MTAHAQATGLPSRTPGFSRVLLAEWTKLRSLRSTLWSLGLLVVVMIGVTAGIAALISANWGQVATPESRNVILADPAGQILNAGLGIGQLTICVLGVMIITGEYSTGVIRASLLAVPRRIPMLAAKGLVFAAVVLVVGELVAFPSFLLGAAILHSHVSASLGGDGVLRAVLGVGLYLAVLGMFAMAIGALVRHTAGAIAGVVGFVIVLEPLAQLLPGTWGAHVHGYLPTVAGRTITHAAPEPGEVLSAWQGFGIFCLWTAVLLAAAGYLLLRRDAS